MKNLKEVLSKLKELKFVKFDSDNKLFTDKGLQVSYRINTMPRFSDMTFQSILHVADLETEKNVFSWGATDEDENKEIVVFFKNRISELREEKYQKEKQVKGDFMDFLTS